MAYPGDLFIVSGVEPSTLFEWADNRRMVYQCTTESLKKIQVLKS